MAKEPTTEPDITSSKRTLPLLMLEDHGFNARQASTIAQGELNGFQTAAAPILSKSLS
jgi:hypothetical protein